MERLTRHHDQPKRQDLYDRLAEYEDLGLTPEEIRQRLGLAPAQPAPAPSGPPVILISDAAKLMSEREMMQRLSELRTGAALGMLRVGCEAIDRLTCDMQNASIECRSMEKMTERQRDALRADALREAFDALLDEAGVI